MGRQITRATCLKDKLKVIFFLYKVPCAVEEPSGYKLFSFFLALESKEMG